MQPKIKTYRELEAVVKERLNAPECPALRRIVEATGIPLGRLSEYKNGKAPLSFERVDLLARFLSIKYAVEKY